MLTPAQEAVAVQRAIAINPANAMPVRTVARTPVGRRGGPFRLALLIENRWPRAGVDLSVQFLDNAPKELRKRILAHMNAWTKTANIRFRETNGVGLVRIARLDEPEDMAGYWSYVGTQILGIDDDQPTLNLDGFTMRTSEAEFRRVVRHEAGHTLGFEHEHMRSDLVKRIDKRKAIAFYDRDQGWDAKETKEQVLTPLADASIMGTTESDPTSIMCYQIPAEITKDRKAIPGGEDINANDFAFAAKVYPKTGVPPKPPRTPLPLENAKISGGTPPPEGATAKPGEESESSQPRNKKKPTAQARTTKRPARGAAPIAGGPVTLEQAKALVRARQPRHALRSQRGPLPAASPENVGAERKKLEVRRRQEIKRRIQEYKELLEIMKRRGVKGLTPKPAKAGRRRAPGMPVAKRAPAAQPLQVFAEGDSWFDYPIPFFGGGVIPRLQDKLGVPILNLAKAGDEVRFMLGVEERRILARQFTDGCPAGGPWDALLFSGGGNDIVANPMALWVRDFDPAIPAKDLIHQPRFKAALELVRAGYEDLISLRDTLSPGTHLIFHAYDFALPDGRGVCFMGPWLKPTFDLRKFPAGSAARFEVVKAMLKQFAELMLSLERPNSVTFINTQGTLTPNASSWHNELHPSRDGFRKFATLFHTKLKALFPGRVL